jgi:quercetin dioxygenase-like cupin family protein
MIITRWQGPEENEQDLQALAEMIFRREDLVPQEETLQPGQTFRDLRLPFNELRVILSGEVLMNIAGTQLLLRPGDRIEIPAHTRHSKEPRGQSPCRSLTAFRIL